MERDIPALVVQTVELRRAQLALCNPSGHEAIAAADAIPALARLLGTTNTQHVAAQALSNPRLLWVVLARGAACGSRFPVQSRVCQPHQPDSHRSRVKWPSERWVASQQSSELQLLPPSCWQRRSDRPLERL